MRRKVIPLLLGTLLILSIGFSVNLIQPASAALESWLPTTSYPIGIAQENCVVSSGFVYCIAGFTTSAGTATDAVYFAPISSGGVGAWSPTAKKPFPGSSCVADAGFVYCIGGIGPTNATYFAQLSSNGVGPWSPTTNYPVATQYLRCVVNSGFVYCIGGGPFVFTGTGVYFAPLSSSGIGKWVATTNYPIPVAGQSCIVNQGFVYCIGGGNFTNAVYFASLSSSGVGPWTATTNYPIGVIFESCIVSSSSAYCIGGDVANNTPPTNAVYFASLSSSGVGPWLSTTNYPVNVDTHSCVVSSDMGFVYCVGGNSGSGFTPSSAVYYVTISAMPRRTTSTSVTCNPSSLVVNQASSCLATVTDTTSTPTSPTGSVSFSSSSSGFFSPTSTCTLVSSSSSTGGCSVSYTPSTGSEGTHVITGVYTGDSSHARSFGSFSLTVTKHSTSTSVGCNPSSIALNQPTTCNGTVTDTSAVPTSPTGVVSFRSGSPGNFSPSPTCTLVSTSSSTSSCSANYTPLPCSTSGCEGTQTITGVYTGDATHQFSFSSFNLTVTKRTTSTMVSCSKAKGGIDCAATVTDTSPGTTITPTGTLNWISSGTGTFSPATCTLSGSGSSAICSVTYIPSKGKATLITITATYSGDVHHFGGSGSTTIKSS